MNNKLIFTFLIGFIIQTGFSQTFDKAKLDNYFQALENNNKFMGSVAVSQNGKLIYTKSVGYADIETNTKANENSKYRIGSISKTFTTVLILKATEEHKLDLTQTIDKYFPTVTNASKITISQLLYHRSGIPNFTNDKSYLNWNTQSKKESEMLEIVVKSGSDFEPDSKAEYSNSNFLLLSYILEKVYKKNYSKVLEDKIIKPLGLQNTFFGGKINLKNNECYSYKFLANWNKETETDLSIPMGAGAIVSTPTDLTIFSTALFEGKLISKENVAQMETIKDKFGMGLFQIPFYDNIGYGHTGGIDGFRSVFSYFPKDKISYALTSNATNYDNNKITIVVLSSVYGKPYDIPNFKTYELTTEDLDKYLGVYSSKEIPIKITITKSDKILMAQATGQSAFALDATEKDKFKFDPAGVAIEFNLATKQLILKQHGGAFTFTKE
jgi:D-alanyl-D-alanine carboxypeptidase